MGDSQHTQNIEINQVIGENEKCVFSLMGKTKQTFWPTQYFISFYEGRALESVFYHRQLVHEAQFD